MTTYKLVPRGMMLAATKRRMARRRFKTRAAAVKVMRHEYLTKGGAWAVRWVKS